MDILPQLTKYIGGRHHGIQIKDFRREKQQGCKKVTPRRPDKIMAGRHTFSATTGNINQSKTRIVGIPDVAADLSVQKPRSMMAVSRTQILPGWLLNRPAADILQESRSGPSDSFALLSPVSRSKFMAALDTLINVHSQLALSAATHDLSQFYAA